MLQQLVQLPAIRRNLDQNPEARQIAPKYRPDIDGLRAVAVLLVVGFHCFPGVLRGGFIGVDIFFVISGYLITSIISSNLRANRFSIFSFYNRRIRRIFPALLLVMIASLVFGWFTLFAAEYRQLAKHLAGGAAFSSNFILYSESGYFDNTSASKPMLHLWSLAIEEQFYLFWPLLLWFVSKRRWKPLYIIAIIGVLSFACNLYLVGRNPTAAFYWPISRFWELMIGGALALSGKLPVFSKYLSRNVQSSLGAVLIALGTIFIVHENRFPGFWALLPCLGAFFAISAGNDGWFNRHVLASKPFVWVGLISYPLYLWHWPLLVFTWTIEWGVRGFAGRLLAVAASFLLAWLTYEYVEKPIRHRTGRTAALSLAGAMAAVACVALIIVSNGGVEARAAVANSTFKGEVARQFSGPIWNYTANDNCLRRFPFQQANDYGWWFCMLERNEPPTFIVIGNSYANQFYPGLIREPRFANQNFLSIGDCDAARFDNTVDPTIEKSHPCYGMKQQAQEKFIDDLVVANKSIRYAILAGINRDPDPLYKQRLRERVDFLESHGVKVILFVPHLKASFDIRECYTRPLAPRRSDCTVPLSARDDLNARFKPIADYVRATNPQTLIFDENSVFCESGKCNVIRDGLPLYRDQFDHISEYGSALVAQSLANFLQQKLPDAVTLDSAAKK